MGGPGGAFALSDLSSDGRGCVVSSYALARPWFTFLWRPIELDPVQLVMAVYPQSARFRSGPTLRPGLAYFYVIGPRNDAKLLKIFLAAAFSRPCFSASARMTKRLVLAQA